MNDLHLTATEKDEVLDFLCTYAFDDLKEDLNLTEGMGKLIRYLCLNHDGSFKDRCKR